MAVLSKAKGFFLTGLSPFWVLYLRARGVECGREVRMIGRPRLNRKKGSIIKLGNRVTLCSTGMTNPVAELGTCRLATVTPKAEIILHDDVGISSTLICCAIKVEIGAGTQIGGGVIILDTDFHIAGPDGSWPNDPEAAARPISIGKKCFIGARAIILKGVTIGDGAILGAGAVASRNIPAGAIYAGNPAQEVKRRATNTIDGEE